jgi:hypothetical protein
MSFISPGYEEPGADGALPAFVERAQQDVQWQAALSRFGYRRVKAAYARQMRESPKAEIFFGIQHLNLYPTMEFVRTWMKSEKKRALQRVRWTFVAAMLVTIASALVFTFALRSIH